MKDGEKLLPKPIKALGSTSLHSTISASEGARRLKLEGLSKNRFPKTKRLQIIQYGLLLIDKIQTSSSKGMYYSAEGSVSIQEVIERTEMSHT